VKFVSSLPFAYHVLNSVLFCKIVSKDNFIEDIALCSLSYKINTLIIAAVKRNKIFSCYISLLKFFVYLHFYDYLPKSTFHTAVNTSPKQHYVKIQLSNK